MKVTWNNPYDYVRPAFLIYLVINSVGLVLYFYFDTRISNFAKYEQRNYYDASDSFTYIFTAVPVLALSLLVNAIWGIKVLMAVVRRKDFHPLLALLAVLAFWAIDFGLCTYRARMAIGN